MCNHIKFESTFKQSLMMPSTLTLLEYMRIVKMCWTINKEFA